MQVSLDTKRLDLAFGLCFLLLLSLPIFFPQLRLSFFAPFLIIACYKKSLPICLLLAFLCGLLFDLLSTHSRLGLYSLDFSLTVVLLFPQRRNFFADSPSTLPIMTFFFGSLSTLIMAIIVYCFEMKNIFSLPWMFTDLLIMPLADAAYAFLCFILPPLLLGQRRLRGKDYFH